MTARGLWGEPSEELKREWEAEKAARARRQA